MKRLAAALMMTASGIVFAAESDEPPPEFDRQSYREGYRRGFDDGYARGYRKALEESRPAISPPPPPLPIAPPPPPPPPRPNGPITVTGAYYGTQHRNCDATRFLARRANGKASYSVEVTNEICGDPSPGDRKSLEVTYVCGNLARTASANEHRTINLECRF